VEPEYVTEMLEIYFICGLCNDSVSSRDETYVVSNNRVINE
jgi:hypothetical protein